jgi:hypothetical protein
MEAPLLPALPGYDSPELIAHGTAALVFRAIQTRLNRPVAIKVITADTESMPVNAQRELATTVALSSQPHIVSIIDTGFTHDDHPYIVMEYCEGGSYAQILRRGGPLPVDDVVEVGIKIGEALHAAHQAGIVHRDVKPSNILRSRFGPALTDFGIARAPDELGGTLTREMMTPHHASPEALLHQAQSGISDVYSLASTMWTLLLGHPPFVDPSRPAMDLYAFRDRVLHEALPQLTRDDVPNWLGTELGRAMSKLPAQRHASAREFADALRRGALGLPPTADASSAAAIPIQAAVEVHVPGVPAQAWPVPGGVAAPARETGAPPSRAAAQVPHQTEAHQTEAHQTAVEPTGVPEPTDALSDEGGWLGPALGIPGPGSGPGIPGSGVAGPAAAYGSETTAHPFPTRHFAEGDLVPPGPGRRGALVAALVAVAVVAVAGAAVLLLAAPGRAPGHQAPAGAPSGGPSPTATQFITAAAEGAPQRVRLDDRGTSVTISWTDPTAGTVPFVVTGKSSTGEQLGLRDLRPAITNVTYGSLDPKVNYCFLVTAVYSGTRVAPADWTCTSR